MEQPVDIRNVRPLRPLRVLVAARDARFNRVAGFLLARRGFEVDVLHRPSTVLDAVTRTGADVVIIDGSDSISETAKLAGSLEALFPHITVVVVADEPVDSADGLKLHPKWTSLETLALNLEAMHLGFERS